MSDSVRVSLDPQDYDLNEWVEFEDMTGVAFGELGPTAVNATVVRALVFLTLRRAQPDITLEEAGQIKPKMIAWPEQENPTQPATLTPLDRPERRRKSS